MAISVALVIDFILEKIQNVKLRNIFMAIFAVMISQQLMADSAIIKFTTDYETSMQYVRKTMSEVKILSTQSEVQGLFAKNTKDVVKPPLNYQDLSNYIQAGYKYLILDPQSFVSLTESGRRFTFPLAGYLGFIDKVVKPIQEYPHFSPALLKRFVFDHNESLSQSIKFLHQNQDGKLGKLKIYDLEMCVDAINQFVSKSKKDK